MSPLLSSGEPEYFLGFRPRFEGVGAGDSSAGGASGDVEERLAAWTASTPLPPGEDIESGGEE